MLERLIAMIAERSFQISDTPSFKLASGKLSRYYVNCRIITLDPEGMYLVGHLIYGRLGDSTIDAVGGPSLGDDDVPTRLQRQEAVSRLP